MQQKIKAFYPKPDAVEKIAKELAAKKTVRLLADKWQIPNDIAIGFVRDRVLLRGREPH